MLPSFRCPQALLAGGFAAWPDSLSFSPLNFAPSTTVWPMPFAVSSTPVPSLPSPIFFAPVSTSRVADLTFDSSAAVAGAAIQPIRAASGIATARSLLVVMVGASSCPHAPQGTAGRSPAEGPATQPRRSGRSVDNRASGWPAGMTASWPSRTTGSCCSIIQTSLPPTAAPAEPRPSRTEASTSQIPVTIRTAASTLMPVFSRLRGESTRAHAARVRGPIALVVLLVLVETVDRAAAGAADATAGRALAAALAAAGDRSARGTDRGADNRPDRAVLDDFH